MTNSRFQYKEMTNKGCIKVLSVILVVSGLFACTNTCISHMQNMPYSHKANNLVNKAKFSKTRSQSKKL